MTLKNALNYFESLASEKRKKSEIKAQREFIQILNSLEDRNLSAAEIQSIEKELDNLNLESAANSSKKSLTQFKKYLKDTFSLTRKGHYTNLGIALGSTFGVLFGVVVLSSFERSLGIAYGISFGMFIGLMIGSYMDSQVKIAGNML